MIRRATKTDIPQLLTMGEQFAAYLGNAVAYSVARSETVLRGLMDKGIVFVSEQDGQLNGGIMGLMAPIWYAEALAATELALWVAPDSRTGRVSRELVKAFEEWAKSQGATHITMSDLCIEGEYPAGSWFNRLGYRVIERTHAKEVS